MRCDAATELRRPNDWSRWWRWRHLVHSISLLQSLLQHLHCAPVPRQTPAVYTALCRFPRSPSLPTYLSLICSNSNSQGNFSYHSASYDLQVVQTSNTSLLFTARISIMIRFCVLWVYYGLLFYAAVLRGRYYWLADQISSVQRQLISFYSSPTPAICLFCIEFVQKLWYCNCSRDTILVMIWCHDFAVFCTLAAGPIGQGGLRPAHFLAFVGRPYLWPAHFFGWYKLFLFIYSINQSINLFVNIASAQHSR